MKWPKINGRKSLSDDNYSIWKLIPKPQQWPLCDKRHCFQLYPHTRNAFNATNILFDTVSLSVSACA